MIIISDDNNNDDNDDEYSTSACHDEMYTSANPVAMMVTLICPSYFSSTTAPKITFASGLAIEVTASDAALTSISVMSGPPVTL